MSLLQKIFEQMQYLTKRELRLKLSQIQNDILTSATKNQILTQIRLNLIIESERAHIRRMEVENE